MPVYFYDPPDRFVAGAVGQPGERIFYLQATSNGRVTSVVLEKFQVSLLAERIDELLDEVLRRTGGSTAIPAAAPAALRDDGPLDLPLTEDFRVGAIALAWDSDGDRVVIEAQEESDQPVEPLADDVPPDGPRARCAGFPWTPPGTSARGRTATGSAAMADRAAAAAGDMDIPDGEQAALDLLERGTLEVEGRLVDASNATLYCTIKGGGAEAACVYKPVAGERPLWDFPTGTLAGREVAAYVVPRAAGWNIVPPTVMRDGPFGLGMVQLWIDLDPEVDVIALSRRSDHTGLREMAVFDAVVNNADRKIGHLLPVADGHLYGCDHGVCFSEDDKLRTVLWQWRGKTLPKRSVEVLRRLADDLAAGWLAGELSKYLTRAEVGATRGRVTRLLKHRVHPYPSEDWPAIPWPPV